MGKLKIIFNNGAHLGDVFFAQPFINNVVNTNGDQVEYYVWVTYSQFIFSDLKNVKNVDDCPELIQILGNIIDYVNNRYIYVFYSDLNILVINTWIGIMNHKFNPSEGIREIFKDYLEECNVVSYLDCYRVILNLIRDRIGIHIAYDFTPELAFPTFPKSVPIVEFDTFKEKMTSENKRIVFLNNYTAHSGQTISLCTSTDYLYVIEFLCNKGYIVILPEEDPHIVQHIQTHNIGNVHFCNEFIKSSLCDHRNSSEIY